MKQRCCCTGLIKKKNKAQVQFKQAPSSSQQSGQRPDSSEQHSYLYIFASQFLHGFSRAFFSFSLAILSLHQRFSVPVHSGLHAALLQRITGEHLWGGSLSSALLFLTLSLIISLSGVDDNVEWSALNDIEKKTLPVGPCQKWTGNQAQQAKVFSKTCKKYSMNLTTWLITPILMMNKSIVNTPIQIVTPKDILYFVIPGHLTKNY